MTEADNRITNKELVDLFGVNMPLKAVELLINNPNKLSTDALRAKLREIAKGHEPLTIDRKDSGEAWIRRGDEWVMQVDDWVVDRWRQENHSQKYLQTVLAMHND